MEIINILKIKDGKILNKNKNNMNIFNDKKTSV